MSPLDDMPQIGQIIIDDPVALEYARTTGPRLGPTVRAVLVELSRFADPDTGYCCPTQAQIAATLEMSRDTVISALKDLEGLGIIVIRPVPGIGGKQNEYVFTACEHGWRTMAMNEKERSQLLASYRLQARQLREELADKARNVEELQKDVAELRALLERDAGDPAISVPVHQRDAHAAFNVGQMADIEGVERVDTEGFPDEPGAVGEAEGADVVSPPSIAGQNGGTSDIGTSGETKVTHVVGRLEEGSPDEKCLSDASISAEPRGEDSHSSSESGEPHGTSAAAAFSAHGNVPAQSNEAVPIRIPKDTAEPESNQDSGSPNSAPDDEPTGIPGPAPAPGNIRATATAEGAVVLTWNALEHQGITGYEISRMTGYMGRGVKVSTVAGRNNTAYRDTDVQRGPRQAYRVRGVGENGPGEWSDKVVIAVDL